MKIIKWDLIILPLVAAGSNDVLRRHSVKLGAMITCAAMLARQALRNRQAL